MSGAHEAWREQLRTDGREALLALLSGRASLGRLSAAEPEDVSYQAVEKEGTVTAIWEMQGQKHLRTIDPRSNEGKQILALFETAG